MLHEIFQACLDENSFTIDSMRHHAEDALQKQFVILTVLNISEDKAREELATYFDGFIQWASTYLGRSSPGNRVKFYGSENGSVVKVTKLHALEESVWSPMYGLKGYIDLSVEVSVTNGTTTNDQIIPIELKSGKCDPKFSPKGKMDHRAQVLMYLLMMSDKYDRDITNGMLYYFKESQVFGVDKVQNEVRAILQMRNLLASSLINAKITYNKSQQSGSLDVASNSSQQAKSNSIERDVEDLLFEVKYLTPEPPPTIQDARECKRCYMLNTCALYNRVFESPEPNKLGEEFEERTGHVTNIHAEYMKKWITCLDLESLEMNHFRKEMWSMTGPEREKVGRCISCMVVVDEGAMSVGVYHYRMRRHADGPNTSLKSIGIDIDSYVTISTEVGHISVSSGYITEMTDTEIVVKLKRELKAEGELEECLYRVDLDEYEIQYKHQRGIVLSLFDHEPINDNVINLRELVAEERRPRFKTEKTIPDLEKIKQYQWYKQELNSDQTDAIERVLRAEDYSLILGMPGTGKTTTIVYVVKSLLELGKKVLVTAHTHTAVDNMLLKLKSIGVSEFVRIGRKKDVHVQLHDSLVDSNTNECSDGRIDTTEKLEKLLLNKKLFGATCLATDPLLQVQDFDYCIVDEASQITHTECVGPLFYAKKFVLVGDHNQLPPLVKNNVAREMGMGESLFKVLSNKHGDIAMTVLSYQYRMNEQVLTLCNKLVYGDALKCGNEQVANGKLQLPNDDTTERTWLDEIISPEQPVMFINTDTLDYGRENRLGHKVFNDFEADLLCEIVSALLARGCDAKAIGVMSPFRSQVTMIRTKLRSSSGVMCNTIDKFQGLDNDVTIMSLVRSNEQKEINELLKERSRLNVALTRARHKLIIIGSLDTFKIHEPYCTLLTFMLEKGWIYDMPNVPSITDVASIGLMQQTSEETGEDEVMVDEEKSTPIRTISQAMFGDVFDVEVKPTHKVSVNPFIKNLKIASQVRQTKQTTTSTQNSLLFTMVSFNSPLNVL
jgi:DNA replication ATP-dependent helicase Dna2